MKKNFRFNKSNLVKVLFIFFIGFVSRIIISNYFDVNVFLDYTNYISILYYFSLSSLSVYFDQLFSFHLSTPTNAEFINVKYLNNDSKTGNLFFSNNDNSTTTQSPIHHPLHHKVRCKLS
jgi:hypothetical protein